MSWPIRFTKALLCATCVLAVAVSAAGCSTGKTDAGSVGTAGASAPFAIDIAQTYLTIENRTGGPVSDIQLAIVPAGILQPFKTSLGRMDTGEKRSVMFNQFTGNGISFNRNVSKGRRITLSATSITGQKYEQEVAFQ